MDGLEQQLAARQPQIRPTTGLESPYVHPMKGVLNSGQRVGLEDILMSVGRNVLPAVGFTDDPLEAATGVAGVGSKVGVANASKIYRPVVSELNRIIRDLPAPNLDLSALLNRVTGRFIPHRTPINIPEYAQDALKFPEGFMNYTSRPQGLIDEFVKQRTSLPFDSAKIHDQLFRPLPPKIPGEKPQIVQRKGSSKRHKRSTQTRLLSDDVSEAEKSRIFKDIDRGMKPSHVAEKYNLNYDHLNKMLGLRK